MVAARIGKNGSVRQIAGYQSDPNDTRTRYVSWAIFEIAWGTAINRNTGEEGDLTRGRMSMHRVYVYHVRHDYVSRAAVLCGEFIATMCWECIYFQVHVIAGDGNKAAYLTTPKTPGCPTYEVSLVQFWLDKMVNTATQSRIKHVGPSPPIRATHTLFLVHTRILYISTITSGETMLIRTQRNLQRILKGMETVA